MSPSDFRRPERFNAHVQAKVTESLAARVAQISEEFDVPKSTVVRVLMERGLAAVETER